MQRLEIPGLKEKDLPDNQQVSFHCGCNIYTTFSQYIAQDGRDNNDDSSGGIRNGDNKSRGPGSSSRWNTPVVRK